MSSSYKPLQTHGRFIEVWTPPKEPFIQYEKSDEEWCRYFGIGTVEKVPEALYDVRDENGDLVGYCRANPVERRRYPIQLPVAKQFDWSTAISPTHPPSFRTIELSVWDYDINGQQFSCWMVHLRDAADLVMTNWIVLLDRDRKHDFAHELRTKYFKSDRYARERFIGS